MKGPKYIADIFLCHPLKRTTKRDDTYLQFMLRYQTYIDKTFVQTCRCNSLSRPPPQNITPG